jgi:hypothetical protein
MSGNGARRVRGDKSALLETEREKRHYGRGKSDDVGIAVAGSEASRVTLAEQVSSISLALTLWPGRPG